MTVFLYKPQTNVFLIHARLLLILSFADNKSLAAITFLSNLNCLVEVTRTQYLQLFDLGTPSLITLYYD